MPREASLPRLPGTLPVFHSPTRACIAGPHQAATGHIKHVPLQELGTIDGVVDHPLLAQNSPSHSKARHHQSWRQETWVVVTPASTLPVCLSNPPSSDISLEQQGKCIRV